MKKRIGQAIVLAVVASTGAGSTEPKTPLSLQSAQLERGQFYYTVLDESAADRAHVIPECPSLNDSALGQLQSKSLSCDRAYVTPSNIKAVRCVATVDGLVFLIFRSKKACMRDRAAALAVDE